MEGPELPHRLGWLNHWSDATAALLGFPDDRRDEEWSNCARRIDGGWMIRITAEPLDLARPAHIDRLQRAYARFAPLGRAPR